MWWEEGWLVCVLFCWFFVVRDRGRGTACVCCFALLCFALLCFALLCFALLYLSVWRRRGRNGGGQADVCALYIPENVFHTDRQTSTHPFIHIYIHIHYIPEKVSIRPRAYPARPLLKKVDLEASMPSSMRLRRPTKRPGTTMSPVVVVVVVVVVGWLGGQGCVWR